MPAHTPPFSAPPPFLDAHKSSAREYKIQNNGDQRRKLGKTRRKKYSHKIKGIGNEAPDGWKIRQEKSVKCERKQP